MSVSWAQWKRKRDQDSLKKDLRNKSPDVPTMPPVTGVWIGNSSSIMPNSSASSYPPSSSGPFSRLQREVLQEEQDFQIKQEDGQIKVVLSKEPILIKKRSLQF